MFNTRRIKVYIFCVCLRLFQSVQIVVKLAMLELPVSHAVMAVEQQLLTRLTSVSVSDLILHA